MKVSADQLWAALRAHQGDRTAAGGALGLSYDSITHRIKDARDGGAMPADVDALLKTHRQTAHRNRPASGGWGWEGHHRPGDWGWGQYRQPHVRPVPERHHTPLLGTDVLAARWGMTPGDLASLIHQGRVTGKVECVKPGGDRTVQLLFPDNAGILPPGQQVPPAERLEVQSLRAWADRHGLSEAQALWLERRGHLRVYRGPVRALVAADTPAPDERLRERSRRCTINPENTTARIEVLALAGRVASEIGALTGTPPLHVQQILSRLRRTGRIPQAAARVLTRRGHP